MHFLLALFTCILLVFWHYQDPKIFPHCIILHYIQQYVVLALNSVIFNYTQYILLYFCIAIYVTSNK